MLIDFRAALLPKIIRVTCVVVAFFCFNLYSQSKDVYTLPLLPLTPPALNKSDQTGNMGTVGQYYNRKAELTRISNIKDINSKTTVIGSTSSTSSTSNSTSQTTDHTYVEHGLAIETSGSETVFNTVYDSRKFNLDDLTKTAINDQVLIDKISKYKTDSLSTDAGAKETLRKDAVDILTSLHKEVFTADKTSMSRGDIYTLNQALTPDYSTNKCTFDCDTSGYVYLQVLETLSKDLPVVEVICIRTDDLNRSNHVFLRWKYAANSFINWETTKGIESSSLESKRYADKQTYSCMETDPVTETNAFYSDFYFNSGSLKASLNDHAGAITDFNGAIAKGTKNPNLYVFYHTRAVEKNKTSDYDGATADFTSAINAAANISPSPLYYIYNNRAVVEHSAGKDAAALADFNQAVSLKPNFVSSYASRGALKEKMKDYTGAIADFTKVLELVTPTDNGAESTIVATHNDRAKLRMITKDYAGAIADYKDLLRLNPNDQGTLQKLLLAEQQLHPSK